MSQSNPPAGDAMPVTQSMQRWQSHKVVRAAKIVALHTYVTGAKRLILDPAHCRGVVGEVLLDDVPLSRFPCPGDAGSGIGGYLVVYEDGFRSWSPAEAFEGGYRKLIDDLPAVDQPCGIDAAEHGVKVVEPNFGGAFRTELKGDFPDAELADLRKRIEAVRSCCDIQKSPGNGDQSEYMRGMANGLLLAMHILDDDQGEAPFLEALEPGLKEGKRLLREALDAREVHPVDADREGPLTDPEHRDQRTEGAVAMLDYIRDDMLVKDYRAALRSVGSAVRQRERLRKAGRLTRMETVQ